MTYNRRVVVTGAGSGIGRAIARRLARAGAQVAVNDRDQSSLAVVAAEIGAHPLPGNVGEADGVARVVDEAHNVLGGVDVWFGNAGVHRGRGLGAADSDWVDSFQINVMAHVRAARLLVPRWIAHGGGRYVVTASAAGILTMLGSPAYSVTKHAAVAFAEWLSATYRHQGIIVQVVCPQAVHTPMLDSTNEVQDLVGHDGVLTPEQVAAAVWQALADDRFFVFPHPEVEQYLRRKAANEDGWLAGMNRSQQRLNERLTPS